MNELHDPDARIIGHMPGLLMNVYPPQMPFCQADVGVEVLKCARLLRSPGGHHLSFSVTHVTHDVQPRVEYPYTLFTSIHNSHKNRHTAAAFIC